MIKDILERVDKLADILPQIFKERRDLTDNALRAISHALNETYFYYQSRNLGTPRDLEREQQLSKYWSAAAIPMRHVDESLAELCDLKSEYWVSPDNWPISKIHELGISLESVRDKYRGLLNKKSKTN